METLLALILLLPLSGALFNTIFGRILSRQSGETVACGVIWGSFAGSAVLFLRFREPVRIEYSTWLADFDFQAPLAFQIDQLSLSLILMITFVCGLIHLYSVGYMKDDPSYARYFALLNIFVFAMLVLVLAENLPLLYLGWEGVGFCSYGLIGFWYRDPHNATAGRKAFIVTRIGDTAFGIAIIWMFQLFSTESIAQINTMGFLMPSGVITALGILLLIGAAGKSAQLPLSVWLPDAMAGPTPVSAQIHAATMVTAGVYLLARLFPLIGVSPVACAAIAITGGLTALYAATCACFQRDLKRILAYSTMSQIGLMVLGVGAGALTAATFHLLTHAFFKALLFLGAGCVITALHHRQDIFEMGGLKQELPAVYWPFLAGSLCLAGMPLTSAFFSKDALLAAVMARGGMLFGALAVLGFVTALLTSYYTFRMLLVVFHGTERHQIQRPSTVMTATLVPLSVIALIGGVFNLPGSGMLGTFLAAVPGFPAPGHGEEMLLQIGASALSLSGFLLAWMRYAGHRRAHTMATESADQPGYARFFLNGWMLDALYRVAVINPFERLCRLLWKRADQAGIDGVVNGVGRGSLHLGTLSAAWSSGRVATALYAVAGGAAAALAFAAWRVLA